MISPEKIRTEATTWWKLVLQSYIEGHSIFPKTIPVGRVKPAHITERFESLQNEVSALHKNSKQEKGTGYIVNSAFQTFNRTGTHELPVSVTFHRLEDYLGFIGKKAEWKIFTQNVTIILEQLPILKEWVTENAIELTYDAISWDGLLKVCRYILENPRPNLYIRQLPIKVHTKFIENNETLLISLLNFLVPDHIRDADQKSIAKRFYLKYDEPLIRMRFLTDDVHGQDMFRDISVPLSSFTHNPPDAKNIIITENKMNFLTLPKLVNTIAIWSGGGFKVSYLRAVDWLKDKKLFYWGDIDEHGFQILHQIRSYHKHVISIMMDKLTYEQHEEYIESGSLNPVQSLSMLNLDEAKLYQYLKERPGRNRLEQEKISQGYVEAFFKRLLLE